jgi:hypothetical protein
MKTWEVEVHLGSGGDTDSIATYLVYAEDEGDAEDTALGNSRHLINATANLIRNPGAVDEMDYDGVLMSEKAKGIKAEALDDLADNETEDEAEYHRLRREAAELREDEAAHERMTGQHADRGSELDDPKHPTYHDRMSDASDARD